MKIISWNVNGLRANIRNKGVNWVMDQNPEIICFQEIKVHPDQLTQDTLQLFDQYQLYWNPASRLGYSGVAMLTSVKPNKIQLGLDDPAFDGEGRLIVARFQDLTVLNVYVPNGRRDRSRVKYKLDFYARLLDICDELHQKGEKVILCGDLNTAHREIDLKNPKANLNTSGFLPEERAWIDHYLSHGFVDIFRAVNPNLEKYTWWTYRYNARSKNIGWRLDYFLISASLIPQIQGTSINDEVLGSDHCPITLTVDI
jgi:exodeoxyribonuclease-3